MATYTRCAATCAHLDKNRCHILPRPELHCLHCCKGKTVYAPQIVFLNCGGSSALPRGLWYHYSYGTVAMYKGDWEKFGGFSDGFENKVTWGGEDWDIIDNAVRSGLEIERKRSPWVYHYYHTKAGMW
ncbi:hypothetical protein ACROYT_G036345 [Oculina patagonica]